MKGRVVTGILLAGVLLHGNAFAQTQTKAQQKCISAMNKGMAKVAGAQLKANSKCAKDFAKGKNASAEVCWTDPAKVTAAQTKVCDSETKKCTEAPTFGKQPCLNVGNQSEFMAHNFVEDVFGSSNADGGITTCATSKPGCKCQGKGLKSSNKLYSTRLKTFNKCKKAGLKDASITNADALEACIAADPKMKVSKAEAKLAKAITKSCAAATPPFAAGACDLLTGDLLTACLEQRVRCWVCLTVNEADGLSIDCDTFDDNNTENNGSCSNPD